MEFELITWLYVLGGSAREDKEIKVFAIFILMDNFLAYKAFPSWSVSPSFFLFTQKSAWLQARIFLHPPTSSLISYLYIRYHQLEHGPTQGTWKSRHNNNAYIVQPVTDESIECELHISTHMSFPGCLPYRCWTITITLTQPPVPSCPYVHNSDYLITQSWL